MFSGNIVLDTLIEDLERESPRKSRSYSSGIPTLTESNLPTTNSNNPHLPAANSEEDVLESNGQTKQTLDSQTRLIIEQKRKAALKKLRLTKEQKT